MESYIIPIISAIIIFPIIAFLITIPFMIINYNKYGSISKLRTIIIYSFILYLLCSIFLVLLPLPSFEYVNNLNIPKYQLKIFNFVNEFINYSGISFNDFSTYLYAIKTPFFYQPLFNIFLTIPFGIYLRYYYKCSFKKTVLFSLLLTLFFEVTQLTGIYGIYSRNYRMFDIDDILFNTIGGIIGYFLCKPILKILPSRDNIDYKSYIIGKNVTGLRRLMSFIIDSFFSYLLLGIILIFDLINNNELNFIMLYKDYLISKYIILVLIPIIFNGKTIGKSLVKLSIKDNNTKLFQLIIRCNLMYIILYIVPLFIYILLHNNNLISIIIMFLYLIYLLYSIYILFSNKLFWYEYISKTKNISTILSR